VESENDHSTNVSLSLSEWILGCGDTLETRVKEDSVFLLTSLSTFNGEPYISGGLLENQEVVFVALVDAFRSNQIA
jgi:hypothetical protein